MAAKTMMTMRGLVIGPLARNQFTRITENCKQAVSAHAKRRRTFGAHQIVKLAGAQPWLATTLFQNEVHHLLVLADLGIKRAITLVIRLARNAHEQASRADTQVLDVPLREDLPGRFFTTETP